MASVIGEVYRRNAARRHVFCPDSCDTFTLPSADRTTKWLERLLDDQELARNSLRPLHKYARASKHRHLLTDLLTADQFGKIYKWLYNSLLKTRLAKSKFGVSDMSMFPLRSLAKFRALLVASVMCAAASAAHAASEQSVYFFKGGADGASPNSTLINVDGTLYGTTTGGGGSSNCEKGCGTVFSVTSAGVEKVIYAFKGGSDGESPRAGLINVNGTLYGTTSLGGKGSGTIFKITPAGVKTVLHAFGGSDGYFPTADLIYGGGGTIYGTTFYGGATNNGTVFRVTTGGAESVIHSFKFGSDGAGPNSKLIFLGNVLYGTTEYGGAPGDNEQTPGNGTVFKVAAHGVETVLYAFKGGSDSSGPNSLVYVGGALFGTTGGSTTSATCTVGCGTVFEVTLAGTERVIYAFKGDEVPNSLINVGYVLYGTTELGGKSNDCGYHYGCGTVFQVTTAGAYTLLYSFGIDCCGIYPMGSLVNVAGTLYGTTWQGGDFTCKCGSVFALTPPASAKLEQP